jgi:hypothetical protein
MFTVFKKILDPKSELTDEDASKVSDFVLCRWLSGDKRTLPIAQMLNFYYNIPVKYKLEVIQKMVNGRIKFIPYPKSKKSEEDYDSIAKYFNISIQKAKMYSEFLNEEDITYISKQLGSMKQ